MTTQPLRLSDVQARYNAASGGPWVTDHRGALMSTVSSDAGEYVAGGMWFEPDAEFIAHARTDLPKLVGALQAVVGRHRMSTDDPRPPGRCVDCGQEWPCPTLHLIADAGIEVES